MGKRNESTALGRYIREARLAKGLTQIELFQRSGVEQYYISQIELGKVKRPGVEILAALATGLDVSVDSLRVAMGDVVVRMEVSPTDELILVPIRGYVPAPCRSEAERERTVEIPIPKAWVEQSRYPLFAVMICGDCGIPTLRAGDVVICEEYHGQDIGDGAIVYVKNGSDDYTLKAHDAGNTVLGIARQRYGSL